MITIPLITNSINWLIQTTAVTIIALFLGFILANILSRILHQLLTHAEINRLLSNTTIKTDMESLLARYAKIAAYTTTFLIILNHFNLLTTTLLTLLTIATLFFTLEIIINLKDIIPNYVAGWTLRKNLLTGQHYSTPHYTGTITTIHTTEITLKTKEGLTISIPYLFLRKTTHLPTGSRY